MGSQLRVKKSGTFPAAIGQTQTTWKTGIEGFAFEQFVDESGNTWVRLAGGLTGTGPAGEAVSLAVDTLGNLRIALPSALTNSTPSNSTSIAYEASRKVKSTAGVLMGLSGYNSKASAQFILIVDHGAETIPPNGTVPAVVISVAAASNFSYDPGAYGRKFSAGIWVVNSSTAQTVTVGSADVWIDGQYQ